MRWVYGLCWGALLCPLLAAAQDAKPVAKASAIVGTWNSLDRHVAIGSLFQPVHGVRKREGVVRFEQQGDKLIGYAVVADHQAISFQERWKEGRTELRNVKFADNKLSFEFDIAEWRMTAGPIAVEDRKIENQGTIRVEAQLQSERLVGKWGMFLKDGTEVFRGEWEATRAKDAEPPKKPDVIKPKVLAVLRGHTNNIKALSFSADGRTLVSASFDKTVRVWDVATGKERFTLRGHPALAEFVVITPDGKTVISADQRGVIKTWDAVTGQERLTMETGKGRLESMDLMSDGRTLATSWDNQVIVFRDIATGREMQSLRLEMGQTWRPDGSVHTSHGPEVLASSPDGRTAIVPAPRVEGFDPIGLWDVAAAKFRLTMPKIGTYALSTVPFHPGGRIVVVGHAKGTEAIKLVHVATGEWWAELKGDNHNESCFRAVFTKDGNILATAEGPNSEIRLWDVRGLWHARPTGPLPSGDLEALWTDLANEDAARAHRAIWALAGTPEKAIPLLSARLLPVVAADEKTTARLIADLDSDRFTVRDEAERALEKLGEAAGPELRKALTSTVSLAVRRRVEALLAKLETLSPDGLRLLRAVEALEHAGTPDARQLLEKLAGGVPEARQTREAKAALERLAKRPS